MRSAFSSDSAVSSANRWTRQQPLTRSAKAVFYAPLLWGRTLHRATGGEQLRGVLLHHRNPNANRGSRERGRTVTSTEEEFTGGAWSPVPGLRQSGSSIWAERSQEDDKSNIKPLSILRSVVSAGSYSGEYLRGDGSSIELWTSFALPIRTARRTPCTHGNLG